MLAEHLWRLNSGCEYSEAVGSVLLVATVPLVQVVTSTVYWVFIAGKNAKLTVVTVLKNSVLWPGKPIEKHLVVVNSLTWDALSPLAMRTDLLLPRRCLWPCRAAAAVRLGLSPFKILRTFPYCFQVSCAGTCWGCYAEMQCRVCRLRRDKLSMLPEPQPLICSHQQREWVHRFSEGYWAVALFQIFPRKSLSMRGCPGVSFLLAQGQQEKVFQHSPSMPVINRVMKSKESPYGSHCPAVWERKDERTPWTYWLVVGLTKECVDGCGGCAGMWRRCQGIFRRTRIKVTFLYNSLYSEASYFKIPNSLKQVNDSMHRRIFTH